MDDVMVAPRGATTVPKGALALLQPPKSTKTWKPVAHETLAENLSRALSSQQIQITREEYAIQRHAALFFGVLDLAFDEDTEKRAAVGFLAANDKSSTTRIAVGVRLLACDSLLFSSRLIFLPKQSSKTDLPTELSDFAARFVQRYTELNQNVKRLKRQKLSLGRGKECLFDVFVLRIVPSRLFHFVVKDSLATYAHAKDAFSQWDICRCLSRHIKRLPPGPRFQTYTKLGKYFNLP
jgi:hypothetical protein